MKQKKALITGGAGFIGRWVVNQCLQAGYEVAVYDNLVAGSLDNVVDFIDSIEFIEADITDEAALTAAFQTIQPDVVFHLAAHHFIPFCNDHPIETLRVNVEGTYRVLSTAARFGAHRAVIASTGAMYPSLDGELHEDTDLAPADIYGLSKLQAEETAAYIARSTPLSCVAARLFNTYGPYETNPHLIPHIMESLRSGPSVELGNIHTKRDYIYVEDTARLLFACAEAEVEQYSVVNIGTGQEYSAEEIVDRLSEILEATITINVDQDRVRAVDKMHQRASIERLKQMTGDVPPYSLDEGFKKLVRHENLEIAKGAQ